MGIKGLTKLLADNAPSSMKEREFASYFGRKIAVDASMHIYQFMVVVGRQGDQILTNDAGEVTSHLQGMFFRTIRMLDAGMKPVFVFDGKPPTLKAEELKKRKELKQGADDGLKAATEAGDAELIEKFAKRSVRVTKEHNEECKKLLRLMGVPVVEAPCEAEAQCAALQRADKVFAVSSEDMDTLCFGARMVRNLMTPASAKMSIVEIESEKAIEELGLTRDQFVDMCILCGCDYADTIAGIGPVRALKLIKELGSLDALVKEIKEKGPDSKQKIPDNFPYEEARRLFLQAEVTDPKDLPEFKWENPDEEGIVAFLCGEKAFNEERVKSGIAKLKASKSKASQGRLESFFGAAVSKPSTLKRKEEPKKGKGAKSGPAAKKGKSGSMFKKK
eukprot:CAMPEP_0182873408 /NCGR_PEP_ID=MMETSP0034_2-20130328/12310_1 /TAXON_ID=156128 /ORGANISM="Nephroselmis pyriformis, Strain CCMP717" /LENGTH=389 /DNA_ID=CAMNT_0025006053 /DNA_START=18 /DNA_END=1187 /DNA_ORIENTATION=-